jgi:uncharacterized membrane protein YfcA
VEFAQQLGVGAMAFVVAAVIAGGFVKGYSGFGASMFWVGTLSLVLSPQRVIPMVLLWEVASSVQLLPEVWRKIEWRSLGWLFLGACIATPVGAFLLASLPADTVRIAIRIIVFVGSYLIWRGFAWKGMPGRAVSTGVGSAFGLLNGGTALGGPPIVLFYLATPVGAAASRASIVAFFLATDAFAALSQVVTGTLTLDALYVAALLLPLVLLGTWLGARRFSYTEPANFKRFALLVLMSLGILVVARALF